MLALDLSPATVIVGLVVLALVFLSARRLWRNGTCDCHKDNPKGGSSCAGGCSGCSGCGAADKMVSDMQRSAKASR